MDDNDHLLPGLYGAVVYDSKDPLKLGRVKLKVGVLGDAFPTDWAIVVRPIAGPNWKMFTPLQEGDGCFVMFMGGEVEHPIVLGSYFAAPGGESEVQDELERDSPDAFGLSSKSGHEFIVDDGVEAPGIRWSTAGGHQLIFDDRPGKEAIFLIHKTGSQQQITSKGDFVFQHNDGTQISMSNGNIMGVAKNGSTMLLGEQAIVSDKTGKNILTLGKKSATLLSGDDVILKAPTVSLLSSAVNLGDGASKSLTIAEALADLFDKHTHATAVGPSGPPLPPNTAAMVNLSPATAFASKSIKVKGNA